MLVLFIVVNNTYNIMQYKRNNFELIFGVTGIFISLVVGATFTLYFLNISKAGLKSDLSSEEMSLIYGSQCVTHFSSQ